MLLPYILQTAAAPGTGTFTLLPAPTGRRAYYPAFAHAAVAFYRADDNAGVWEEGWGTVSNTGTLTRNVLKNSAGTLVALNFTGTVDVFCDIPTPRASWLNNSGVLAFDTGTRVNRGVTVKLTAVQSVVNNANQTVGWSATLFDDASFYSGGANTRLTVPAGVTRVRVAFGATFAPNANGYRRAQALLNGATSGSGMPSASTVSVGASDNTFLGASGGPVVVTPGDYVTLIAFQNSGGAVNLTANDTWLSMECVA